MHNMLAEAIVEVAAKELGGDRVMVIDMLTRPETKNFRPGMPMDNLRLTLKSVPAEGTVPDVHISLVKTKSSGTEVSRQEKVVRWTDARHFLRGLFTTQKLFDFKQHDPFYTVTTEAGHKQTV